MLVSAKLKGTLVFGVAAMGYLLLVPDAFLWKCPIHLTTRWLGPGCGGQRWFAAFLRGDLFAAWQANALFVCCASPWVHAVSQPLVPSLGIKTMTKKVQGFGLTKELQGLVIRFS